MRLLRIAAATALAAMLMVLPATPAGAARHCRHGYVLKHGKCVKRPHHSTPPPLY